MSVLQQLSSWVPFLQTLLWVLLSIAFTVYFRSGIRAIMDSVARRVEGGAALKLGPIELGEFRTELDVMQRKVDGAAELTARLFLTTMSGPMFENLEKLCNGFGPYERNNGLERELYHLRDIGYIEVESIKNIPPQGPQLSDHVVVTKTGKEFVRLRKQMFAMQDMGPTEREPPTRSGS